MLAHQGTVERSNADDHRCMNSVLGKNVTNGHGGGILPMEDTNHQELKKMENVTNRECFLWFGERCSNLRSQIAKD